MASRRDPKAKLQFRKNLRWAKRLWPAEIGIRQVEALRILTESCLFSVPAGDLLCLQGNWYATHSGLLQLAHRKGCFGIQVQSIRELGDPASGRFTFKATALLAKHPKPTSEQVEQAMSGVICRCGTYQRIHAAIQRASGGAL